ncbi:MAG: hypothetical protein ACI9VR_000853 [Cognaticolwellia sp.]
MWNVEDLEYYQFMNSSLSLEASSSPNSKQAGPAAADHLADGLVDPLVVQFENGPGTQPAATSAAAEGVSGGGGPLPHRDTIQRSFGAFDISGVKAHTGGKAAEANDTFGSNAYAMGGSVGFKNAPSLHTAAHEAAHTVQQEQGVQLEGGFGSAGDVYEKHADSVADKVVAGESAEPLLSSGPAGGQAGSAVQFDGGAVGKLAAINLVEPTDVVSKLMKSAESAEGGTLGLGKNAAKSAFMEHYFKGLPKAAQWHICADFAGEAITSGTDLGGLQTKAWKAIDSGWIRDVVDWEGLADRARVAFDNKKELIAGANAINPADVAKHSVTGGKAVNAGTGQALKLGGASQDSTNASQLGGPSLAILGSLVALVELGSNAYNGQGVAELAQAGAEATVGAARDSARLAHNVIAQYGAAGSAAGSWAAFGGLAIFAGLVQAGVGLYTFVKKKAQKEELTRLAGLVDPILKPIADHAAVNAGIAMKGAVGKGASGVLTSAGGVALLALGMSNPVGWMVMAGVGAVATAIGIGMAIWSMYEKSKAKKTLAIAALKDSHGLSEKSTDNEVQTAIGKQGYISLDHWYKNYTLNQAKALYASAHQDEDAEGKGRAREMIKALGAGTVKDTKSPSIDSIASKMRG